MKTFFPGLALCTLLLGSAVMLPAAAQAQTQAPGASAPASYSPAYRRDLLSILSTMRLADLAMAGYRQGLKQAITGDTVLLDNLSRRSADPALIERLKERMLPLVGDTIPPAEARVLADFLQSPTGSKLASFIVRKTQEPQLTLLDMKFSTAELRELSTLERNAELGRAMNSFGQLGKSERMRDIITQFGRDEGLDVPSAMQSVVAKELRSLLDGESSPAAQPATPDLQGSLAGLLRDSSQRMAATQRRYVAAIEAAKIDSLLSAEKLSSPDELARNLKAVMGLQDALRQRMSDIDTTIEEMLKSADRFEKDNPAMKSMMADFKRGIETGYGRQLSFQENQQKLLGLYQRILQLLSANPGVYRRSGDQLVFDNDEVLKSFNSLIDQVNNEVARETDMVKAATERTRNFIDQSERKP